MYFTYHVMYLCRIKPNSSNITTVEKKTDWRLWILTSRNVVYVHSEIWSLCSKFVTELWSTEGLQYHTSVQVTADEISDRRSCDSVPTLDHPFCLHIIWSPSLCILYTTRGLDKCREIWRKRSCVQAFVFEYICISDAHVNHGGRAHKTSNE